MTAAPPAPRTKTLVRERLLPAARALPRVCLIAAPAGYGKTVLLHQIAARLGIPGVIATARGWSEGGTLGDAARSLPRPAYLAVDDLHELEGSRTEAELLELVERGPEDLKLLVATRTTPSANLSRLRANGELWDVAAEDLRFRSWEVDQVFRDVWGDPLTSPEVTTLARRTGGWAACLQLFHLATCGRGSGHRAVALASLRGASAVTAAYLTQNVLDGLPPHLRSFLVATAVLRTLTPASCDELTGSRGSAALLEELERRRLLERSVDRATWRCPRVLRTHLEAVLVEEAGRDAAARWLAAAAILERDGSVADAVHAYLRAGEIGGAIRLLASHGPAVADAAGADLIDEASCGDPWLTLASARWLRAGGRAEEAIAAYRRAEEASQGTSAGAASADERRALACWLDPLEQPPHDWSGALRSSLSQRPLRPPGVAGSPHGEMARGLAALARGEVAQATKSLAAASDDGDASPATALASRIGLAAALVLGGDERGAEIAERAAEEAEILDLSWMVGLAHAISGMSGRGGPPHPRFEDPLGTILCCLLDGIGALSRGEIPPGSFDDAVTQSHRLGLVALEAWARAGQALARVRAGAPGSLEEARGAQALARVAGARAPLAIALLALAESSDDAALTETAQALADECGVALPRRAEPDERPAVVVRCFGGLAIEVDGERESLEGLRPRTRQVLRVLLLHTPQPVHRDVLIDALWPHLPPERAASSLHVAVSSLRQALGAVPGLSIERDGDAYVLDAAPEVEIDLLRFRAAVASPTGSTLAVDLYRGDVFPEEGPAEWIVEAREHLRDRAAHAAAARARELLSDDPRAAAVACERGLELDRHLDDLWRLLIDACTRAGNHAEASRAAARYESVLEDLGVALSSR